MLGHLFVWCGSHADNLTREELGRIINTRTGRDGPPGMEGTEMSEFEILLGKGAGCAYEAAGCSVRT